MMKKRYHCVLTIAGSDSSGGAGIQADLKTIAAIGCYGTSVVTALTAQNTQGVMAVHAPPVSFVREQLEAVLGDIGADAVKIGMLYSKNVIETVSEALKKYRAKNIVFDPVMAAQSGNALSRGKVVAAMKKHLLPLVTLLTPNLPEAALFLDREITTPEEMHQGARDLTDFGVGSVLLKGGHLKARKESTDVLFIGPEDRFVTLEGKRIDTRNDHGTGCTLSSAVACFLAEGDPLEEACRSAKAFLQAAIEAGAEFEIGRGHGPVHHFFKYW
jgi:hydroxymethylpyrimidine/phosphomethylpyrimidine kinase